MNNQHIFKEYQKMIDLSTCIGNVKNRAHGALSGAPPNEFQCVFQFFFRSKVPLNEHEGLFTTTSRNNFSSMTWLETAMCHNQPSTRAKVSHTEDFPFFLKQKIAPLINLSQFLTKNYSTTPGVSMHTWKSEGNPQAKF